MGKTAENMTHKKALEMRKFLDGLFSNKSLQVYFVAIKKTYYVLPTDDWSVFLYGQHKKSSFLVELATLAHAIETISDELHTRISTYDAGTTEPDERVAVEIY